MDELINCGELQVQELHRVVIPKNIRDKYKITPGDSVEVFIKIAKSGKNV